MFLARGSKCLLQITHIVFHVILMLIESRHALNQVLNMYTEAGTRNPEP